MGEDFKVAFDKAIQVAASCATEPICFAGSGPVICWMDLSNPPLETIDTSAKQAPKPIEKANAADVDDADSPNVGFGGYGGGGMPPDPSVDLTFAGLEVPPGTITMQPGQEVELDEISTQRILCFELRYFCNSYLDYNIMAYDA